MPGQSKSVATSSGQHLVHHGHLERWDVLPVQLGHGAVLGVVGSTVLLGCGAVDLAVFFNRLEGTNCQRCFFEKVPIP